MNSEWIVAYGLGGFLGRFLAPETMGMVYGRQVVVRVSGFEFLGEVLTQTVPTTAAMIDASHSGEVLRIASPTDVAEEQRLRKEARAVLEHAQSIVASCTPDVLLLDAEISLDRAQVIFHTLGPETSRWTDFVSAFQQRYPYQVGLHDLSAAPHGITEETERACKEEGCGKEKGGCSACGETASCSTGTCSRGTVNTAEELTAHFQRLREEMERHSQRTSLFG